MIIAVSIVVGVLVTGLLYRTLFYDVADFLDGLITLFTIFLMEKRRWPFAPRHSSPTPEDFQDEGWSSGIRFLVLLALAAGSGYLVYIALHKYFG